MPGPQSPITRRVCLGVAGGGWGSGATGARRSAEVARARAEAETLARVAGASADEDPLGPLVGQLVVAFGQQAAAVLRAEGGPPAERWAVEAGAGDPVPASPGDATETLALGRGPVLALVGP